MRSRPPRRGSLRIRLELGLAAFAPALGLLAFRTRGSFCALLFLIPAAVGVIVIVAGCMRVRRGNAEPFSLDSIEDLSGEVLWHIGAYLIPVLIDTSKSIEEVVISAIVVGLIIHIHVATGRVHVNPLLYFFGYRVYSARNGETTFYLVARSDVSEWKDSRLCVRIASGLLVERERRKIA